MTKPFHPGNACRAGVTAAKMAQKGYEANPDIMEHRFGYAAVYDGVDYSRQGNAGLILVQDVVFVKRTAI